MEDQVIRVGILGAGKHATATHGPALKILQARRPGEIELAAVCDLKISRAKAFAAGFGFRQAYSNIDDMLAAEELDALLAITPLALTENVAAQLLPHKIPLLIEKPPGTSSDGCRRLVELARAHGTLHMVSFNRRFNPAILRARSWIAEDPEARRPKLILGRMIRHARTEPAFAVGTGIHLIDVILGILGRPNHVSCRKIETATADCFFYIAHLQFAGTAAQIAISSSAGALEETVEIHGQDYLLKIGIKNPSAELHREKNLVWSWTPAPGDPPDLLDVIAETETFLDAARTGSPMRPDLSDGLISLITAEAIQRGGDFDFPSA